MADLEQIQKALGVDVAMSSDMMSALVKWTRMYENKPSWLSPSVHSMNLPASISNEIARSITIEMSVEVSGSPRADYINEAIQYLLPKLRSAVEFGVAKGGFMIKPFVYDDYIEFDIVQAGNFYPVSFNPSGSITGVFFIETKKINTAYYTRLEYHSFFRRTHTVKSFAYMSTNPEMLGLNVSLASVPGWSDIEPIAVIENLDKPLYSYFKYPAANQIDTSSPLGVSCYSRSVDFIKQADEIWSGLIWEFKSGERAIYVDNQALVPTKGADGKTVYTMGSGEKRLYRTMGSGANVGDEEMFKDWTPDFREASILSGLDAVLKKIEFSSGLAYGTISDPNTTETTKTATEIKTTKQRSFATIVDGQKALSKCLTDLIYVVNAYCDLYSLAPDGEYEIKQTYDDSIVADHDTQFLQDSQEIGMGTMSKLEFRMRNHNETLEQAKAALALVDAENVTEPLVL